MKKKVKGRNSKVEPIPLTWEDEPGEDSYDER